jgi:hypothetical protein
MSPELGVRKAIQCRRLACQDIFYKVACGIRLIGAVPKPSSSPVGPEYLGVVGGVLHIISFVPLLIFQSKNLII